uniref:outer membrane protein assembly factor BamB family protein n=1 Tax=Actinotalea sp. JY-7885 TaxID=2758576 RepID=UPI00165E1ACD
VRGGRAGAVRGRRRLLGAGAVALLVVTTVLVSERESERDRALAASLSGVPGVMAPLDGALAERWRVDGDRVVGQAGDVVLIADGDATTAVDARDGELLWTRPSPDGRSGSCRPLADLAGRSMPPVGRQGPEVGAPSGPDVVCVRSGRTGGRDIAPPALREAASGAASTTVTSVDGATGVEGRALTVAGVLVASDVLDGDLVLVTDADDVRLHVTRWDPGTGAVRWRLVVGRDVAAGLRHVGWRDGTVVVAGLDETVAYDLRDGRPADVEQLDAATSAVEQRDLPDGARLVWRHARSATFPGGSGSVVLADGTRTVLPGPALRTGLRDRSAPGTLLVATSGTTVGAVDVATGAVLWQAPGSRRTRVPVTVAGRAVLVEAGTATAVDVRTGAVAWQVGPLGGEAHAPALTDGTVVLLHHREEGRDALVAHDVRTGSPAWRAPLPEGTRHVVGPLDGRVLVVGEGWVAGLA